MEIVKYAFIVVGGVVVFLFAGLWVMFLLQSILRELPGIAREFLPWVCKLLVIFSVLYFFSWLATEGIISSGVSMFFNFFCIFGMFLVFFKQIWIWIRRIYRGAFPAED